MAETDKYSPQEENLGKECMFWQDRCNYPKAEAQGWILCRGIIGGKCIVLYPNVQIDPIEIEGGLSKNNSQE